MIRTSSICLCLTMLLFTASLTFISCSEEPKDKDPKVALVGTMWETSLDIPDIEEIFTEEELEISGVLNFTTETEGAIKLSNGDVSYQFKLTYSYDATNEGYRIMLNFMDEKYPLTARVDWTTEILTLYEGEYDVAILQCKRVK